MFTAVWNRAVLAESDRTMKMESHPYFPPESLQPSHFVAHGGGRSPHPRRAAAAVRR